MHCKRNVRIGFLCLAAVILAACSQAALGSNTQTAPAPTSEPAPEVTWPGEEWQVAASPEDLGWSSEKLALAEEYAGSMGTAALMIIEDGVVVDSWGDITHNYRCHSMRKSLLSALYGIFVEQGSIDLTSTLAGLGIDDKKPLTVDEKQATILDLITARSGVYIRAAGESDSMKSSRPERGSHPPGTFWFYNNWDFNALGTIFDQLSGEQNIYQAFKTHIADPVGMQDYRPSRRYMYESYSIHPYYGFRMSTSDLARFGLLFLRGGQWEDEQVIPQDWVEESTAPYSERAPNSGYGYMWWTGRNDGVFPNVYIDEEVYWAWGYNAHFVMVFPGRELVIVHRENTDQENPPVISNAQIGTLLWLILGANDGEKNLGPAPFLDFETGDILSGDELYTTVEGSTLTRSESGYQVEASFLAGGMVSLFLDGQPFDEGEWWVGDDKLCVEFSSPDIGGGCVMLVLDGSTMMFYDEDGVLTETYNYARLDKE